MGFVNVHDVLVLDSKENIYRFYVYQRKIKLIYYDKESRNSERRTIINDCNDEYDAVISEDGTIYLICQKNDGNVVLVSIKGKIQDERILEAKINGKLRNINIKLINDKIHIFYCVESTEGSNSFRIYHNFLHNNEWIKYPVSDIFSTGILNPFSIVETKNGILLGYYDIINNCEQIFISSFDMNNLKWSERIQITSDNNPKLYLDMISKDDNMLDICYSKYIEGNLVVTYEKYKIEDLNVIKETESLLSNPANCMYPTLVYSNETLWVIWIEYNRLLSSYSEDDGLNWSSPYSWKNTQFQDFARYKFSTNSSAVKNIYKMNYSFGTYGEGVSFIGFGDISEAIEETLKSHIKKKGIDEDMGWSKKHCNNYLDKKEETKYNSSKKQEELKELESKVLNLETKLKELTELIENKLSDIEEQNQKLVSENNKIAEIEKRVNNMEEFLLRRRRGFLR